MCEFCTGALMGSLSFNFIINLMGSKRATLFAAFPIMIFWFLVYFGNVFYLLLVARFIAGWAGGGIQSSVIL